LLCYTVVSVLVLGIGIARDQYYWILGGLLGIILTLMIAVKTVFVRFGGKEQSGDSCPDSLVYVPALVIDTESHNDIHRSMYKHIVSKQYV